MSVSKEIFRTWRDPKGVASRFLAEGPREDRALAWLMGGCLVIFIAQLPRLQHTALATNDELVRLASYEFIAWLFVWPLAFYVIALLITGLLRLFRWKGQGWQVRAVLFWGLLASGPAALLYGLQNGLNGAGVATQLVGAIWLLALGLFWVQGLRAVPKT